jgi:hypothetical protein
MWPGSGLFSAGTMRCSVAVRPGSCRGLHPLTRVRVDLFQAERMGIQADRPGLAQRAPRRDAC